MDHQRLANIVRLASRVPLAEAAPEDINSVASILNLPVPTMPSRIVMERSTTTTAAASSSTCKDGDTSAACEKPVSESSFTLPIALGVIIPVVGAIILFTILSRRHSRKQREEDANDPTKNLDFGMGDVSRKTRKGGMEMDDEKGMGKGRQISLDLANASPYLLPPEMQNSRESLQSLSKSIHKNEDPYRPVTQSYGDGASIRSYSKQGRDGASIMTTSSAAPSRMNDGTGSPKQGLLSNAAAMSQTTPPPAVIRPPRQNPMPPNAIAVNPPTSNLPAIPAPGSIESPITGHGPRRGLPGNPRPSTGIASTPETGPGRESYAGIYDATIRNSNNYLGPSIASELHSAAPSSLPQASSRKSPPPAINTLPTNPKPTLKEPERPRNSEISDYGDGIEVTPPSPVREIVNNKANRYSMDVPPEEFVQAGLGAPGFDAKRLSMGFRPLPPDSLETEDPETRANRIRSFYKEYFDDSKPAPKGQYIEDYDEHLIGGDAAYFDPATNAFVMPFAEPVTRRAMTPPPRAPRFQGAPPRSMHGSMGGIRAFQNTNEGPRASSSASQRGPVQQPKRPLPPPAALTSLPTPSKLKDDAFMQSIEFAPELTVRERAAGRSESPFGERRPYSPAVPVFAPVVSSFDELAAIPSPHMLRKSGTFTSLDFAAPKRFKDPEHMSDAGSIRSARSGISAAHNAAIRNGAYRVSKIPQDAVFTRDDMATTLKPQWGMRSGM
ncbi:Triple functional domain protein [Rutstroemia sp. NJR-2017a WRK4]|nr:Triple functional domain protein [Rutstroemia sp. NJR-2017a WRK4]